MEAETRNEEQPSWAKIPILVSAKLFALMNYKSKKVARLVCADWRFAVDHLTGLSLAVDEYRDGKDFLTFLQMVKLCQVTIGNVVALQKHVQWKYPGALRKVVCQGQIERDWFCNLVLKQCPNLTRLILKGDFLSKLIVDRGGTHPSHPSAIVCPNLTSLEIISPRGNIFPRHFAMSYYLNVFSDPSTSPRNEVESIQNAVSFILKTVRSPRLALLNIFVYENFLIHQQEDYWKQTTFEEFLEAHQISLKEIYLHEFWGKRSSEVSLMRAVPNKLTQMEISIHRYYQIHGNTKLEQDQEFLRRLLSEQTQLMDLTIEFHKMRTFWITDVLCNVITNNKNTLRVLKMQIVRCDEDECVLSGILLSELVCLEEFKLEGDALTNNALTLTDFPWLPKSLRKILTMFMRIEETDFACIHEFKSLKYIELNHIVMGPQEDINPVENNTSTIFASILEQLLRHRELDHLGVSLSRSVNSCERLKNFMERISDGSKSSNPPQNDMPNYYGLVIAHQYEIDDKFDLCKSTNRESIFSDDFVFHIRPKKDTVSLVEVRVEVERRDSSDYFEEELTEDNFATSEGSSGMPSLTPPLHLSGDLDETDPPEGIIMPPDPDQDIS